MTPKHLITRDPNTCCSCLIKMLLQMCMSSRGLLIRLLFLENRFSTDRLPGTATQTRTTRFFWLDKNLTKKLKNTQVQNKHLSSDLFCRSYLSPSPLTPCLYSVFSHISRVTPQTPPVQPNIVWNPWALLYILVDTANFSNILNM